MAYAAYMAHAAQIVSVDAAEVPALIAQGCTQLGEYAD
jgi:hypothetical protein